MRAVRGRSFCADNRCLLHTICYNIMMHNIMVHNTIQKQALRAAWAQERSVGSRGDVAQVLAVAGAAIARDSSRDACRGMSQVMGHTGGALWPSLRRAVSGLAAFAARRRARRRSGGCAA